MNCKYCNKELIDKINICSDCMIKFTKKDKKSLNKRQNKLAVLKRNENKILNFAIALLCLMVIYVVFNMWVNFHSERSMIFKVPLDNNDKRINNEQLEHQEVNSFIGTWIGSDNASDITKISFYDDGIFELTGLGIVTAGEYNLISEKKEVRLAPKVYTSYSEMGQTMKANPSILIEKYKFESKNRLTLINVDGDSVSLTKQEEIEQRSLDLNDENRNDSSDMNSINNSDTSGTSETNNDVKTPANTEKIYKIGDAVTIFDVDLVVNSAEITKDDMPTLKVDITVTNKAGLGNTFALENFKVSLLGASEIPLRENTAYSESYIQYVAGDKYPLINFGAYGRDPNGSYPVTLYFEVPQNFDLSSFSLKYTGVDLEDPFETGTFFINLDQ